MMDTENALNHVATSRRLLNSELESAYKLAAEHCIESVLNPTDNEKKLLAVKYAERYRCAKFIEENITPRLGHAIESLKEDE